jgi:hypothetical protein
MTGLTQIAAMIKAIREVDDKPVQILRIRSEERKSKIMTLK